MKKGASENRVQPIVLVALSERSVVKVQVEQESGELLVIAPETQSGSLLVKPRTTASLTVVLVVRTRSDREILSRQDTLKSRCTLRVRRSMNLA